MYSFQIPVQDLQLKEKAKEGLRVMSHYNSLLRGAAMSPLAGSELGYTRLHATYFMFEL